MKILIAQIAVLLTLNINAQGSYNMYSTYPKTQAPIQQYVPDNINWDAILAEGQRRQALHDQNKKSCEQLIMWIVETKANVSEEQFLTYLNSKQKTLESYQNTDYSLLSNDISQIRNDITKELENYNYRIKNAPLILWNSAKEQMQTAASNSAYPHLQVDNYNSAIKDLTALIELQPDYYNAYFNRGFCYYMLRRWSECANDLSLYNKNATQTKTSLYYLGIAQNNSKNYIESISTWNQLIIIDSTSATLFMSRGYSKMQLGDNPGAILDYKKALRLEPKNALALNNIAWCKFKQKKYKEALVYADRSIELEEDPNSYDTRYEIKLALGDLEGCVSDCNKAIIMSPSLANAYLIRGRAYYRKGNKEQACLDWSKAGELGKVEAYDLIGSYCK